jgi:Fic family protein
METKLVTLVNERVKLRQRLESLLYGTVEIRIKDDKKYLYVHYRENGLAYTKYAGVYNEELYRLILKNNIEARNLKKALREINKTLKTFNYVAKELSEKIKVNIDFVRKHLVETVYKQVVLEDIAATYLDTETIIDGGKVNGLVATDVLKILNLKHAWDFVLNENIITLVTSFEILCDINRLVTEGFYYNAGTIRSVPVSIGGTSWQPPVPIKQVVIEELNQILSSKILLEDKAIALLLYVMKRQIFLDGNKRTAVIFANHLLISKGFGIIAISESLVPQYKVLLISYYEGKDETIKTFLKQHCLVRI